MATGDTPLRYSRWNPKEAWTNSINGTRRNPDTGESKPGRPFYAAGQAWTTFGSVNSRAVTDEPASAVLVNHRHHRATFAVALLAVVALVGTLVVFWPQWTWISLLPIVVFAAPTIAESGRYSINYPPADLWLRDVSRHSDTPAGVGAALVAQLIDDHPGVTIGGQAQNQKVWEQVYEPLADRIATDDDRILFILKTKSVSRPDDS